MTQVDETVVTEAADEAANDVTAEVTEGGAEDMQAAATDLDIHDFRCKNLVVDDIWIPLGEALLIARFSPVWNSAIDGFGNHDPGSGRYGGQRPRWDVLHPGRLWAERCQPRQESPAALRLTVETYLANNPMPAPGL